MNQPTGGGQREGADDHPSQPTNARQVHGDGGTRGHMKNTSGSAREWNGYLGISRPLVPRPLSRGLSPSALRAVSRAAPGLRVQRAGHAGLSRSVHIRRRSRGRRSRRMVLGWGVRTAVLPPRRGSGSSEHDLRLHRVSAAALTRPPRRPIDRRTTQSKRQSKALPSPGAAVPP